MTVSFTQALKWHPDRHIIGKEEAAQKFIEVCARFISTFLVLLELALFVGP